MRSSIGILGAQVGSRLSVYKMLRQHDDCSWQLAIAAALLMSTLAFGRDYTPEECPAIGNSNTRIYHMSGDRNYRQMLVENKKGTKDNRVCFKSSQTAENAGYRRSRSGKGEKPKR